MHTRLQNGKQLITVYANKKPAQKDMKSAVNTYVHWGSQWKYEGEHKGRSLLFRTRKLRDITMLCEIPVIMESIRADCS